MKNFIFMILFSVFMLGLTACSGGSSGDGTVSICTSNSIVGTFNTDEATLDVSIDGNTTVVALGSRGVGIFDTSRKNRPELLIKLDQDAIVYSAKVHDNHMYMYLKSDSTYYLRIVDISDVFNPKKKSDIPFVNISITTKLIKSNWIEFEGDFIHLVGTITAVTGNYHIIDVSDKADPVIESSMTIEEGCGGVNGIINEIKIKDDLAYIGSYKGIDVIDFSDRENPDLVSETLSGCTYKSFDMSGDVLYSAVGYSLYSYDIAKATELPGLGNITSTSTKYILVSEINGTAYTLGLNGEISISDVSKPDDMKDTSQDIFVNPNAYRIVDDNGYIYVADEAGLKIIDTCIR